MTIAKLPMSPIHTAQLSPKEKKRLEGAVADFEAMFMRQMLSAMRKTVPENGLFPENQGETMFRDLLDDEYSRMGSQKSGGVGLKETLLTHLLQRYTTASQLTAPLQKMHPEDAQGLSPEPILPILNE